MSFLTGPMHQHLDGHKELTAHKEVLNLNDLMTFMFRWLTEELNARR